MNKSTIRLSSVLFTLLISACGTLGGRINGSYDFDKSNRNGLVVVSTRIVDKCDRVSGMTAKIFRKDETGWGTDLIVKNFLMKPDIGKDGYFTVYEFPEGDYTIGNISVTGFTLAARSTGNPEMLHFSVDAGKTTYLGEIEFTVVKECSGVVAVVKDEWPRDAKLFETRVNNITSASVKKGLASK